MEEFHIQLTIKQKEDKDLKEYKNRAIQNKNTILIKENKCNQI